MNLLSGADCCWSWVLSSVETGTGIRQEVPNVLP